EKHPRLLYVPVDYVIISLFRRKRIPSNFFAPKHTLNLLYFLTSKHPTAMATSLIDISIIIFDIINSLINYVPHIVAMNIEEQFELIGHTYSMAAGMGAGLYYSLLNIFLNLLMILYFFFSLPFSNAHQETLMKQNYNILFFISGLLGLLGILRSNYLQLPPFGTPEIFVFLAFFLSVKLAKSAFTERGQALLYPKTTKESVGPLNREDALNIPIQITSPFQSMLGRYCHDYPTPRCDNLISRFHHGRILLIFAGIIHI
ncbi:hypothetical protein ACJX0J_034099, partial [Zea mays]